MVLRVLCIFSLIVAHISTLPISISQNEFPKIEIPVIVTDSSFHNEASKGGRFDAIVPETIAPVSKVHFPANSTQLLSTNATKLSRNTVRPGMTVQNYRVSLTPNINDGTFTGILTVSVLVFSDMDESVVFNIGRSLQVTRALWGLGGNPATVPAIAINHDYDESTVEIETGTEGSIYEFEIEYTGSLTMVGAAFWRGSDGDSNTYLAMNLHPLYARHVFPCIDEPTENIQTTFIFNNIDSTYSNIVVNTAPSANSDDSYLDMNSPPHRWGMVAHNFLSVAIPVASTVYVYGRVRYGDNQVSQAINIYYEFLNDWTERIYTEIIPSSQDGRMMIIALPDVDKTWIALSSVCIWEPYIVLEQTDSVAQRANGFVKIAEAMSRQWFGYVLYPENWIDQWIISGLSTYAAYEAFREVSDMSQLDVETLFVTDVIQESLYQDFYEDAALLFPPDAVFGENEIRGQFLPLVSNKAAAIFRMLRLALGSPNSDPIRNAARSLIRSRGLSTINTRGLYDALTPTDGSNPIIGNDIEDFLDPYIQNRGYPVLRVLRNTNGVTVTQEHIQPSVPSNIEYIVPVTYTTSLNPNFENVYPNLVLRNFLSINVALDEEDWILLNLQGQGYYRVEYGLNLWENIIEALNDPEERQKIHPLNRATLVDDALNLARAGITDYDIAFQVVLSMEHETEYAVWKAFVRNMEFLRKRLEAYVDDDEDLDPDIYLRMVRRTISSFEQNIGFTPEVNLIEPTMDTKVRGLVMDHACRAGYQPCIAAAVDWFYDPDNNGAINPNIPRDLRPAVYCAMAKTGDQGVLDLLSNRLLEEEKVHDRVVILESLACCQDSGFINTYLERTIAIDSPYNTEERVRIFKAVAAASHPNSVLATSFLIQRSGNIIEQYGGLDKLTEIMFDLVEHLGDFDVTDMFTRWINEVGSGIEDYKSLLDKSRDMALQNIRWIDNHLLNVYDWIDENDASSLMISLLLLSISLIITTMFS